MGLDMYLMKVRRIGDVDISKIEIAERYLGWERRSKDYEDSTLEEYSGINENEVDHDVVERYRKEYITRYLESDQRKECGYKSIFEDIAYWRKANQIHYWFVKNVQGGEDDCGKYEVTKGQLEKLLNICRVVKENSRMIKGKIKNGQVFRNGEWKDIYEEGEYMEDSTIAKCLLPTVDGFFFGGTDYNEWYMRDIEYTITAIEKVLKETDFENEIVVYHANW